MINLRLRAMLRLVLLVTALPITLATVLAKDVKAQDQTVVVLFSGFGEYQTTGLNTVDQELQTEFGGNPNEPFSSQVFADFDLQDALSYVNSFNDIQNLVVIGDGFGASSAYDLVNTVSEPVNLLIVTNAIARPSLNQPVSTNQFEEILEAAGFTTSDVQQAVEASFLQGQTTISFENAELAVLESAQADQLQDLNTVAAVNEIDALLPVENLTTLPTNANQGINYFYTNGPSSEVQGITSINGFTNINVNQEEALDDNNQISSIPFVQNGIVSSVGDVINVPEPSPTLANLFIGAVLSAFLIMKHKQKK